MKFKDLEPGAKFISQSTSDREVVYMKLMAPAITVGVIKNFFPEEKIEVLSSGAVNPSTAVSISDGRLVSVMDNEEVFMLEMSDT